MGQIYKIILLILFTSSQLIKANDPPEMEVLTYGVYFLSAFLDQKDILKCLPKNISNKLIIFEYPAVQLYILQSTPTVRNIILISEVTIDIVCKVKKSLTNMSSSGDIGDPNPVLAAAQSLLTQSQTNKNNADNQVIINQIYLQICQKFSRRRLWPDIPIPTPPPIPIPPIPIPPIPTPPNPIDIIKQKIKDFISSLPGADDLKNKAVDLFFSNGSVSAAQNALTAAKNLASKAQADFNNAKSEYDNLKKAFDPKVFNQFKNMFGYYKSLIEQTFTFYTSTLFKRVTNGVQTTVDSCKKSNVNLLNSLEQFAELIQNLSDFFKTFKKSGSGKATLIMNLVCQYKSFFSAANYFKQALNSNKDLEKLAYFGKATGTILRAVAQAVQGK